ncbi:MAG TPA: hypothetical protein DCG23_02675 [Deltaproteobacteria bacterium]|nr:hypothetical protein [Deltaproteobacteria bacterium]
MSEYKASTNEDLRKRQKSIDEGEALDKEINQRMDSGEIGVSHGTDNHVGIIMLGLAGVFTLFCLYLIFSISPAH